MSGAATTLAAVVGNNSRLLKYRRRQTLSPTEAWQTTTGFGGDVVQGWESLQAMTYTTVTAAKVDFCYWGQEIMQKGGRFEEAQLFARTVQMGHGRRRSTQTMATQAATRA